MDKNIELAKRNYDTLCDMFDARGFKFKRFDEDFSLFFSCQGDDLPMEFVSMFYPDVNLFVMISELPVKVPAQTSFNVAAAITYVNNLLVDGCFCLDISKGKIKFKITNCYSDTDLSEEAFDYMNYIAIKTVEEYNDKFFGLAKGLMDFKQFMDFVNGGKNNG